jgi:hypothetical protein
MALFSNYLGRAFHGQTLIVLLGWLFLPWTTLAYAWAIHSRGEVAGFQAIVVLIAVLVDLGIVGGGAAKRNRGD